MKHNRTMFDPGSHVERDRVPVRRGRLACAVVLTLSSVTTHALGTGVANAAGNDADANEVVFNTHFGGLGGGRLDIARFGRSNRVLPGQYRVDLYLNDVLVTRRDIMFRDMAGSVGAQACLDLPLLQELGVVMDGIAAADDGCVDLAGAIAGAAVAYDAGDLRLDLSVPQASLLRQARGYVDPGLWDAGMTAATLGYDLNLNHTDTRSGFEGTQAFAGLRAGLNLGGWRLRGRGSLSWSSDGGSDWQSVGAFAQHDVQRLRSQLTLGDAFTPGELFPSVAYRGASLSSDDRMLPDSQVGYAPVVRGTAQTRARVEIRQNEFLVYETTVAPGAFEITDLYPSGHTGDLQVRVIEADGSERHFTVPYAAVPQLLRPGLWRYSATVGEARSKMPGRREPLFAEASYQRGINNWLTAYGGVQVVDDNLYRSAQFGAAFNTPVGALAWDVTGSQARPDEGDTLSGYSTRLTYSKAIPSTRTNFALAGYRYSTGDYLELSDAVALDPRDADASFSQMRPRDRLQLSLSQSLGQRGGTVFASGSHQTYRSDLRNSTSYQVGYSNQLGALAYNLGASRTLDEAGRTDNQYFLSVSMPLGGPSRRPATLSVAGSGGGSAGSTLRAGLSGSAGSDDQFNYGAYVADSSRGEPSVDMTATWHAPYAVFGGGYGWSTQARQASLSASGGIVAHSGGLTLAQRLGDTIGVVQATGGSGASLGDGSHARLDARGYAIASDLRPYRLNQVEIDPKGMSMDVELASSQLQVVPRAGAVMPLRFETSSGRAVLIRARRADGRVLPFGAQVLDAEGTEVGLVGQGGQVFARAGEQGGSLTVQWQERSAQSCAIDYRLPDRDGDDDTGFTTVEATCQ